MPLFDVFCKSCRQINETVGEPDKLKCPNCGSVDIERRWTGSVMIVMPGDPNGSTLGVRKKAWELTHRLSK